MTRLPQSYKQLAIIFYIVGYRDKMDFVQSTYKVNTWLNSVEFILFWFKPAFFHPCCKDLFWLTLLFCGDGGLLSVFQIRIANN